ncbi:CHL4-like protein [Ceratocystis lukuohia]|uniref:CHL4-like protein n=1 Tax=Ceratocystis lukuohia TaxID=2019550 RepID=A0ABR4ML65_9PEZI
MDSIEELQDLYSSMQERKGSKREVVDRMLEGDWREGVTMYQLAMADFQYLYDHPLSQKWTAYRILPLKVQPHTNPDGHDVYKVDNKSLQTPRFHPSTFLEKLQLEALPDTKTHCHFDRHRSLPLLILRVVILDSPYNFNWSRQEGTATSLETARIMYIAFPDAAPFLYITKPSSIGGVNSAFDAKSTRSLVVDGIPKALSRPRERVTLKATDFTSANLSAILQKSSAGRTNEAGGGWSIYADEKKKDTPLERVLPVSPLLDDIQDSNSGPKHKLHDTPESKAVKKRRLVAEGRFGKSALIHDGVGIKQLDIVLANTLVNADEDGDHDEELPKASVRLCFVGSHVFAGIRQLIEAGAIDGEKMPGWMTGEEGVTSGTVVEGRIRGHKGTGM